MFISFFFFNDTATTEIYTLSLHDALPISVLGETGRAKEIHASLRAPPNRDSAPLDRKSTRLNSSHSQISYAVFCLKKKKTDTSSFSAIPDITSVTMFTCVGIRTVCVATSP